MNYLIKADVHRFFKKLIAYLLAITFSIQNVVSASGDSCLHPPSLSKDEAERLRGRLNADTCENVSFGIVVEPDESSVISLSNILLQLLEKDKPTIILPVPVSPFEIKRRPEEDIRTIWELLESA